MTALGHACSDFEVIRGANETLAVDPVLERPPEQILTIATAEDARRLFGERSLLAAETIRCLEGKPPRDPLAVDLGPKWRNEDGEV